MASHPCAAGSQGNSRTPGHQASHAPCSQTEHLETGQLNKFKFEHRHCFEMSVASYLISIYCLGLTKEKKYINVSKMV